MTAKPDELPIWTPAQERIEKSAMHAYARFAERLAARRFTDYEALWRWSIQEPEQFWNSIWDFCGVLGQRGARTVVDRERIPGARWFPDARLNLAENLLRKDFDPASTAIVFWGEDQVKQRLTRAELYRQVATMAAAMRAAGLRTGHCVAASRGICSIR